MTNETNAGVLQDRGFGVHNKNIQWISKGLMQLFIEAFSAVSAAARGLNGAIKPKAFFRLKNHYRMCLLGKNASL